MPLSLLVKWEVVTPNRRLGQWESISNIILYSLVLIDFLSQMWGWFGGGGGCFSCILCYFQHF